MTGDGRRPPGFELTLVVLAATLWGTLPVVYRQIFRISPLSPVALAAWRAGLALLILTPALALTAPGQLRIPRRELPYFSLFGLIGIALFYIAYAVAVERAGVATAAILLYTAPTWVILLARLLYGEPITPRKLAALLLGTAGAALVAGGGLRLRLDPLGVAAGLASGLTYGSYSLFSVRAVRRYSPWTVQLYAFLFGVPLLLAAAGREALLPLGRPALLPWLLYLGVVPTLFANAAFIRALRGIPAGTANIVATLEPVVAAGLAALLLGEAPTFWQVLGGGMVLAGVAVLNLGRRG